MASRPWSRMSRIARAMLAPIPGICSRPWIPCSRKVSATECGRRRSTFAARRYAWTRKRLAPCSANMFATSSSRPAISTLGLTPAALPTCDEFARRLSLGRTVSTSNDFFSRWTERVFILWWIHQFWRRSNRAFPSGSGVCRSPAQELRRRASH